MSGVDEAGANRGDSLPLVAALRAELGDALRAVAWYHDGDRGLVYVHSEVDAPDERLGAALGRRPGTEEPRAFEYAIDAYEEEVVVTLSARSFAAPTAGVGGVALAVERDAPLAGITTAIERAVAAATG